MQKIARLDVGRLSYDEVEAQPAVEKSSDYNVKASDSGKLLVGTKSGSRITFTLPTVAAGKDCVWDFFQTKNKQMTITGGTGNKMYCLQGTLVDSVAFQSFPYLGSACRVICDGSYYYFLNLCGATVTAI